MPQHPRTGNDIAEAGREGEDVFRRRTSTDGGSQQTQPQFAHRSLLKPFALLAVTVASLLGLGGCGGLVLNQSATAGSLVATPSTLAFGTLPVGQSANQTESLVNSGQSPVVISSVSLTDNSFNLTDHLVLPMTLAAGGSLNLHVVFAPSSAGTVSADLKVGSTSPGQGGGMAIGLNGTGVTVPSTTALSSFSCASTSSMGPGTDICTIGLSGPAPSAGFAVSLASSSTAVNVPATAPVPANATTASFTASISAVTAAQTVTLQASGGGITKTVSLQLSAAVPVLSINATSISFGSVNLNTPSTQSVTLSSTGTLPVTVSGASVSGTGFALTGATFPMTLNPGQTAVLSLQFDPTTSGSATGQLIIASNSSTSGTVLIALSGTGQTSLHSITLTWNPPSSTPVPIVGYSVYRAGAGSTSYQLLNSSSDTQTTYVDNVVQSGQTYDYVVKSVDSSGVESSPSNMSSATVP